MSAYLTQYDNNGAISSASTLVTQYTGGGAGRLIALSTMCANAFALAQIAPNAIGYGGTRSVGPEISPVAIPVRIGKRYGVIATNVDVVIPPPPVG